MDKLRLYIWVVLAGLLYYLYIVWQMDYPAAPAAVTAPPRSAAPADSMPPLPDERPATPAPVGKAPASEAVPIVKAAEQIHVRTDVLDLNISSLGGELNRADLIRYPTTQVNGAPPIELFNDSANTYFVARSGLRATGGRAAPDNQAAYTTTAREYVLKDGDNDLKVELNWSDGNGLNVVKTYAFQRNSYIIHIDYRVRNQSNSTWNGASYVQMVRRQPHIETSMFQADSYAHMGPAVYNGKSYHKLKLTTSEDQKYKNTISGGWLAAMQHHFVAAALPDPTKPYDYQLSVEGPDAFSFSYRGPVTEVAVDGEAKFVETLYVGPKLQDQLSAVGSQLELTVDYGWFKTLSQPLFWVLSKVHSFLGNWGWSIIVVTFLIKLVFYKLTEASGRSMAKMREMAPRLKALQERYKDDREQLGRATMEFYKREKINPVAGCLPMLIQMPFWMAFYWVLANSVEMRQAPFMGWITDLTSRDPYFILPIILGIVNFVQFKLNPAPTDPVQAKMMSFMPILMTVMMAWFPSGLALYWITNTLLSILQQWHINRVVADAAKKPSSAKA